MKNSKGNNERIRELESQLSDLKFELEDTRNLFEEENKKRQFYQLIADFTFGWELWIEPGGKIKYCSPSCYDLTGYSSNQILSSADISELLIYEPDVKKYHDFLSKSIDQMLVNQSLEFRILTRTKQLRWCFMNMRGVYDKFGKYLGVRASIQDVTRLKRAMGNIKELETQKAFQNKTKQRLQSELELKDRELVSFLLQLSQKNELISALKKVFDEINADDPKNLKKQVSRFQQLTEGHNSQLIDWPMVEGQLEKLHPGFFFFLFSKHPNISVKDKKLCAYLRLGLSSKEISGLQNLTPQSVEIARVRLRKKLKLSREIRLAKYLSQM